MPISKKLRFEIFKRDGFKCCYCGKSPPEVTLEADHIDPKSKGGQDDINNLVTSCFDCNRGKGAIELNKIPLKLSDNIETLKAQEEQFQEYRRWVKKINFRNKKNCSDLDKIFHSYFLDWHLSKSFQNNSIKKFISLLPKHEVEEAMEIACQFISRKGKNSDQAVRYFCGICWKKIRDREDGKVNHP